MSSSSESELKSAVHGLTYISETDAPIETISLKRHPATPSGLLAFGNHSADSPIQQVSLKIFFRSQDQTDAGMCRLRETIERVLTDIEVFRVGNVDVTYYVVGKSGNQLLGIRTSAVETGSS